MFQLSKGIQHEKAVPSEGSPRMAYLIPTVVPFLNACLLTLNSMTGAVLRASAKAVSRRRGSFIETQMFSLEDSVDNETYLISGRILFHFIFRFES